MVFCEVFFMGMITKIYIVDVTKNLLLVIVQILEHFVVDKSLKSETINQNLHFLITCWLKIKQKPVVCKSSKTNMKAAIND